MENEGIRALFASLGRNIVEFRCPNVMLLDVGNEQGELLAFGMIEDPSCLITWPTHGGGQAGANSGDAMGKKSGVGSLDGTPDVVGE